jgi:hypothetical protein
MEIRSKEMITVQITPAELAFLREAVDEKHTSLMKLLEFKKHEPVWEPVKVSEMPNIAKAINPVAKKTGRQRKAAAPWGYKKDGTPKKRPGRAVEA